MLLLLSYVDPNGVYVFVLLLHCCYCDRSVDDCSLLFTVYSVSSTTASDRCAIFNNSSTPLFSSSFVANQCFIFVKSPNQTFNTAIHTCMTIVAGDTDFSCTTGQLLTNDTLQMLETAGVIQVLFLSYNAYLNNHIFSRTIFYSSI